MHLKLIFLALVMVLSGCVIETAVFGVVRDGAPTFDVVHGGVNQPVTLERAVLYVPRIDAITIVEPHHLVTPSPQFDFATRALLPVGSFHAIANPTNGAPIQTTIQQTAVVVDNDPETGKALSSDFQVSLSNGQRVRGGFGLTLAEPLERTFDLNLDLDLTENHGTTAVLIHFDPRILLDEVDFERAAGCRDAEPADPAAPCHDFTLSDPAVLAQIQARLPAAFTRAEVTCAALSADGAGFCLPWPEQ